MSYKKFSNRTLEGNWFEDRFAPPQVSQQCPDAKDLRDKDPALSWLGSAGVPKPLNTIKRVKKWNTEGVIPNDNFHEVLTTTKADISHPHKLKTQLQKPPAHLNPAGGATHKLISDEKALALAQAYREAPAPWLGYNFTAPTKPKEEHKRYFDTTYSQALRSSEYHLRPKPEEDLNQFTTTYHAVHGTVGPRTASSAGVPAKSAFMDVSNKSKRNVLAAEIMRTGTDPQHNTAIQKMWLPTADPGIQARLNSAEPPLPMADNETSLPLGLGQYAQRANSQKPTGNRRFRTDVTTGPDLHLAMGFR